MKILLISPNTLIVPERVYPIGLDAVRFFLTKHGHSVRLLDYNLHGVTLGQLTRSMSEFAPDLIGIALRNVDDIDITTQGTFLGEYKALVDRIKAFSSVPIVLGGAGYSMFSEQFLDYLGADYGFVGQMDDTFLEFLNSFEKNEPVARIIVAGQDPVLELYAPDLDMVQHYYSQGDSAAVSTRRGCMFSCLYCNYPSIEGSTFRLKPIPGVLEELRQLSSSGINRVVFVDSIFNEPSAYTMELCAEIIRLQIKLSWSAYVTPAGLTSGQLSVYRQAGCVGLEWGIDSFSDTILHNLIKPFTAAQASVAMLAAIQLGIMSQVYLILGGPGEDLATLDQTFAVLADLQPDVFVVMPGLRIYSGTALYEKAKGEGLITASTDLLREKMFYFSKGLTVDELRHYLLEKVSAFPNMAVPAFNIEPYSAKFPRIKKNTTISKWELLSRLPKR